MSERTVCDFQRGTGWRTRKSNNRGSTSTARRLERDKVMQVRGLIMLSMLSMCRVSRNLAKQSSRRPPQDTQRNFQ